MQTSTEWTSFDLGHSKSDELIRTTLDSIPLFENLSVRDWRHLAGLFHQRRFDDGEIVFEAGMPGLGMYIIVAGTVRVLEKRGGEDIELTRLGSGDFFGEMSLIDEVPRSATVISVGDTHLIGIFRPHLQELMHRRPRLGVLLLERLASILVKRLREANRLLAEPQVKSQDRAQ